MKIRGESLELKITFFFLTDIEIRFNLLGSKNHSVSKLGLGQSLGFYTHF